MTSALSKQKTLDLFHQGVEELSDKPASERVKLMRALFRRVCASRFPAKNVEIEWVAQLISMGESQATLIRPQGGPNPKSLKAEEIVLSLIRKGLNPWGRGESIERAERLSATDRQAYEHGHLIFSRAALMQMPELLAALFEHPECPGWETLNKVQTTSGGRFALSCLMSHPTCLDVALKAGLPGGLINERGQSFLFNTLLDQTALEHLLQAGASLEVIDHRGMTAYEYLDAHSEATALKRVGTRHNAKILSDRGIFERLSGKVGTGVELVLPYKEDRDGWQWQPSFLPAPLTRLDAQLVGHLRLNRDDIAPLEKAWQRAPDPKAVHTRQLMALYLISQGGRPQSKGKKFDLGPGDFESDQMAQGLKTYLRLNALTYPNSPTELTLPAAALLRLNDQDRKSVFHAVFKQMGPCAGWERSFRLSGQDVFWAFHAKNGQEGKRFRKELMASWALRDKALILATLTSAFEQKQSASANQPAPWEVTACQDLYEALGETLGKADISLWRGFEKHIDTKRLEALCRQARVGAPKNSGIRRRRNS